jgi:hypothetical protein
VSRVRRFLVSCDGLACIRITIRAYSVIFCMTSESILRCNICSKTGDDSSTQ